jgi:hypothetical protein
VYANDGCFCADEFLNSRGQFGTLILPESRRSALAHMRTSVVFARTTSGLDASSEVLFGHRLVDVLGAMTGYEVAGAGLNFVNRSSSGRRCAPCTRMSGCYTSVMLSPTVWAA